MKSERRKYIRTAFAARVKLVHSSIGEIEVDMRDMSDGGLFLFCGKLVGLQLGERVHVQAIEVQDAPLLEAEVVRCEAAGIGLMFTGD